MSDAAIAWWIWLVGGLSLMLAELLVPSGFFLFFFGVGGLVTALLEAIGLLPGLISQTVAFILISLFSVVLLRKPMLTRFHICNRAEPVRTLVGEVAVALEPISPAAMGRVELHGSPWTARNTGQETIEFNVRCKVEKVDGLTLHVRS